MSEKKAEQSAEQCAGPHGEHPCKPERRDRAGTASDIVRKCSASGMPYASGAAAELASLKHVAKTM